MRRKGGRSKKHQYDGLGCSGRASPTTRQQIYLNDSGRMMKKLGDRPILDEGRQHGEKKKLYYIIT
jgi:hypothetical protein